MIHILFEKLKTMKLEYSNKIKMDAYTTMSAISHGIKNDHWTLLNVWTRQEMTNAFQVL